MYYVVINRINGRDDWFRLTDQLTELGLEAEYDAGGWADNVVCNILPNLAFKNEEDAIVYALKTGNKVYSTVPQRR